jgi:4-hydroxy-2-oxoglutarate aldolase
MTPPLAGIYVALTTPFDGDTIAPDKLRENVRRLNATGVAGYLVLGSTGESVSLTDAESLALVEAVLEAAAPDKKVLVGTAREWTKGTIDFTASLPAHGIAAVLVRPPSYFKSKMTREALKAHYLAVADASRHPVLIYNMPANTGISLEPRFVVDLAPHPNIIGLKESSGSIAFLEEVVRRVPADFHYFVGSGHVVYPGLEMGASGAILAVANAAPELCAEIFRSYKKGEKDRARELQLDLVPLNKALMETYGIAGLKHAQDLRGSHGGPTRLPLLPVDDAAKADIAALLKNLGL